MLTMKGYARHRFALYKVALQRKTLPRVLLMHNITPAQAGLLPTGRATPPPNVAERQHPLRHPHATGKAVGMIRGKRCPRT